MKKLLFIYNPTSGRGMIRSKLAAVLDRFTQAGWLVTAYPTQGKGDAAQAARELGYGYDRVVCCGGDGTLSETVSGLMDLPQPPVLGYIPAGSTNDCAHNLRLPAAMDKAAMVAAGDLTHTWDVGRLNDRSFIYVAAFGAFTEVAYDTPQELKNAFGHMAYIMAGVGRLTDLSPYHIRVEHDGETIEDDFLYGMVCNTLSVGGMRASASADRIVLNDGLFEVVLIRDPVNIVGMANILQSLVRQVRVEGVYVFQTSRLTLTADRPVPWTVDGEYGGTYPVSHIENCRQALTLIRGA